MGLLESWLRTLTVFVGTIGLGAMGLSGLVNVLSDVLEPSAKWDPQGEFNYILSVPMGALLGGTVGAGPLRQENSMTKVPRMFVIVGALTVTLCLGIGVLSAESRGLGLKNCCGRLHPHGVSHP